MLLRVTQKTINKCMAERVGWYNPCPIRETLRQRFGNELILVTGVSIQCGRKYKVPKRVAEFIVNWDNKRPVKPLWAWLSPNPSWWDKFKTKFHKHS